MSRESPRGSQSQHGALTSHSSRIYSLKEAALSTNCVAWAGSLHTTVCCHPGVVETLPNPSSLLPAQAFRRMMTSPAERALYTEP